MDRKLSRVSRKCQINYILFIIFFIYLYYFKYGNKYYLQTNKGGLITCLNYSNIDTKMRFLKVTATLPCAFLCLMQDGKTLHMKGINSTGQKLCFRQKKQKCVHISDLLIHVVFVRTVLFIFPMPRCGRVVKAGGGMKMLISRLKTAAPSFMPKQAPHKPKIAPPDPLFNTYNMLKQAQILSQSFMPKQPPQKRKIAP